MSERVASNPIGKALVVLLVVGGGWMFLRNYQIEGLDQIELKPRSVDEQVASDPLGDFFTRASSGDSAPSLGAGGAHEALLLQSDGIPSTLASKRFDSRGSASSGEQNSRTGNTGSAGVIRIGSWAMAGLGREKFAKPQAMDIFARIVRQFDLIALQQVTANERDLLPRIIELLNRPGRRYDFILGPSVGPDQNGNNELAEQYAFLFDTETIETDRTQLYTVADPGDRISYDPLVGWFRVARVPPERAWTFTMINLRVDSRRAAEEVPLVPQILAAVSADGRGEDDLLLVGMLQADDRQLQTYLGGADRAQMCVRSVPTDIFARYQLANIISPTKTATEFLGRGGVIDFLRLYNLSLAECEELTPHLPVYGEFTATEGN